MSWGSLSKNYDYYETPNSRKTISSDLASPISNKLFNPNSPYHIDTPQKTSSLTPQAKTLSKSKRFPSTRILKEIETHLVDIHDVFPQSVLDALKSLPNFSSSHLIGNIDSQSGYIYLLMSGKMFNNNFKAYLWSLKSSKMEKVQKFPVYQFLLPETNLDLSNQLFIPVSHNHLPSATQIGALAISAEGKIRYWPRASESQRFSEFDVIGLKNEYCSVLSRGTYPGSLILGTSRSRLILINLQSNFQLKQTEIRMQSNILKNISSWWWNGGRFSTKNQEIRKICFPENDDPTTKKSILPLSSSSSSPLPPTSSSVWVLTGDNLSNWIIRRGEPEKVLINFNFIDEIWNRINNDNFNIERSQLLPLDILVFPSKLYLLLAIEGVDGEIKKTHVFFVFIFSIPEVISDTKFINGNNKLELKKVKQIISNNLEEYENIEVSSSVAGFLTPGSNSSLIYIRIGNLVFNFSANEQDDNDSNIISSLITKDASDTIIGMGAFDDNALFIIPRFGLVRVQPYHKGRVMDSSSLNINKSTVETPDNQLLEAFRLYSTTSSPIVSLNSIIQPILEMDDPSSIILNCCLHITDKISVSDPRWAEESSERSNCAQVILYQQLEEKRALHSLFIQFLMDSKLWDTMNFFTRSKLCEFGEKLASASSLRSLHNSIQAQLLKIPKSENLDESYHSETTSFNVLNEIMMKTLTSRGVSKEQWLSLGLGPQDIFYAAVTSIDSIIKPLHDYQATYIEEYQALLTHSDYQTQLTIFSQANRIFEAIFGSAIQYRKFNLSNYFGELLSQPSTESIRFWTWESSHRALLSEQIHRNKIFIDFLSQDKSIKQREIEKPFGNNMDYKFFGTPSKDGREVKNHNIINRQLDSDSTNRSASGSRISTSSRVISDGAGNYGENYSSKTSKNVIGEEINSLIVQLYELSVILLDDIQQQISIYNSLGNPSTELQQRFESLREQLVRPFISKRLDLALKFAESYHEFNTLIKICEATKDHSKLKEYIDRFAAQNFAQHLFRWYEANGCMHQLLTLPPSLGPALAEFLSSSKLQSVAWIHYLKMNMWAEAGDSLYSLAENEVSAERMKNWLSLAKLTRLTHLAPDGFSYLHDPSNDFETFNLASDIILCKNSNFTHPRSKIDCSTDIKINQTLISLRYQYQLQLIDSEKDYKTPWNSEDLIVRFLELSETSKAFSKIDFFSFALELFGSTVSLRSKEHNNQLLIQIWSRCILVDSWESLALSRQQNQLDDESVFSLVRQSVFYGLGYYEKNVSKYLDENILDIALQVVSTSENFLVIKNLLNLAYNQIKIDYENDERNF